jgi:hypothetical protein
VFNINQKSPKFLEEYKEGKEIINYMTLAILAFNSANSSSSSSSTVVGTLLE